MAQDNIHQRLQLAYGDQPKIEIKESDRGEIDESFSCG